jgi:hypothetical protein
VHTFADGPSTPVIFATAQDEDGTYAAASNVSVSVSNVNPSPTIAGAAAATTGNPYTLSLSYSDPGVDTVTRVLVNWGDVSVSGSITTALTETFSVNLASPRQANSVAQTFTHVYSSLTPNPRTVTATVIDDDNATVASNNITVTVAVAAASLSSVSIESVSASFSAFPGPATNPAVNSRSEIHAITLSFSAPVSTATTGTGAGNPLNYTLSASQFDFTSDTLGPGQSFPPPSPNLVTITPTLQAGNTQVVLTFTGNVDGVGPFSLKDGDYVLVASGITDANSLAVPGVQVNFRRLFGDANRNGFLDFSEFAGIFSAQGSRVGDPNYNPAFDFDSDGDVDVSDQIAFFAGGRFANSFGGKPPTA